MEEQNNQNSQFKWDRNKILLAAGAVVLVVAITLSYWMLKKDPETAQGDGGMKYEAVPAAVLVMNSRHLNVVPICSRCAGTAIEEPAAR